MIETVVGVFAAIDVGVAQSSFVAFEAGVGIEFAEKVLHKVQALDPIGVAARDLRECLLLQVRHLNADTPEIVAIIERHLKHLESKNYAAIAKDVRQGRFAYARIRGRRPYRETGWVYLETDPLPRAAAELLRVFDAMKTQLVTRRLAG